jgi:hypothetical protein
VFIPAIGIVGLLIIVLIVVLILALIGGTRGRW